MEDKQQQPHNYKPTRFWAHGWNKVDFNLYAKICKLNRNSEDENNSVNVNEDLLTSFLINNHRNERIEEIIIIPNQEPLEVSTNF